VRSTLSLVIVALAAGLLGGGAAFAVGTMTWDGGETTTVVQERGAAEPTSIPALADDTEARTVGDIYREWGPGVVQITSEVVSESFFGDQRGEALGSGFVIDKQGHVVTNYHVVQGAEQVYVNFSRDDQLEAKVVGVDPSTDLALLEVEAHQRALTPLTLGNSDAVQVGDEVVAIGNPFGLERTVTSGIVSALQRQIQAPNNFTIDKVIQTDAPINRGNSGGPLLNARGEVIGVNTQIATDGTSEGNVGIGFAVPANTVKEVVGELRENGRVDHAYLGVSMQDLDERVAELFNIPAEGVLITEVVEGGPADEAGLRGGDTSVVVDGQSYVLGGDVIVTLDGGALESADELRSLVASKEPGDEIELEVRRGDETETITVELGRQPTSPSR
jgi:S1-C subfamily serine protease